MNATFKTVLLWLSLVIVIFLAYHFAQIQKKEAPLKFSEFMKMNYKALMGAVAGLAIAPIRAL